jgi:hypothetical protein
MRRTTPGLVGLAVSGKKENLLIAASELLYAIYSVPVVCSDIYFGLGPPRARVSFLRLTISVSNQLCFVLSSGSRCRFQRRGCCLPVLGEAGLERMATIRGRLSVGCNMQILLFSTTALAHVLILLLLSPAIERAQARPSNLVDPCINISAQAAAMPSPPVPRYSNLFLAAAENSVESVCLLLQKGADINARNT